MHNNKPVLVILTPGFPASESDCTCLPAQQNFIKAVNKNYPEVKIIVISFQYPFVKKEYHWNGNLIYAFGGRNRNGLYRRLLWYRIAEQLKKLQQEQGINGILSFWCDECAFIAHRFSKKYGTRHFCWLLGQDAKPGNRFVLKMGNTGKIFISLSDFIYHEFKMNYNIRPFATVPLGICTDEFDSGEKNRDIDILATGSLIPLKQFEIVLKITAALKNKFEKISVMICGDGPELVNLKDLAAKLGIAGNVQFTGLLPHKEVLNLMQRVKVFLHPSSYEGFGMVCAEALYAGAQVISFCRPMHAAIKNWHITSDTAAMQHTAEKLLSDLPVPEKMLFYSSDNTAHTVIKLFGWQAAD